MPLVGQRALLAAFWFMIMIAALSAPNYAQTGSSPPNGVQAASGEQDGTELTLVVKDGGMKLGEAIVRIKSDNSISIRRDAFLVAVKEAFRKEAMDALSNSLSSKDNLTISDIQNAGLVISFDAVALELAIEPKVEQRPRGEIDATVQGSIAPENVLQPATVSGFVNTRFGAAYERVEGSPGGYSYPALMFEGGARWQDFVVEAEGLLETDGVFSRQATRLVFDMANEAVRITAGDLDLRPEGSFSVPPILGVAIEKSYSDLQPNKNIRPIGKRSFRIERLSDVQVLVNGAEARRLRLQPGEYDLNDLPLASGTNNIQLRIKDDFGRDETVDFSILFNRALLDPGISEWSLAAGFATNVGLGSPSYDPDSRIVTGTYRRGISESITGSTSGQASEQTALLGGSALAQTVFGLASLEAAASATSVGDVGWSAGTQLELQTAQLSDSLNSAQFGVEFLSQDFTRALNQVRTEGARVRLSGSIGQRLPGDISASLSGYLQIAEEELDRGYGAGFSLSKSIDQEWTLSFSGSYDQRNDTSVTESGGMALFGRLNFRPDTNSSITAQYESPSNTASIGGQTNFRDQDRTAALSAEWEHTPATGEEDADTLANADLYYSDTRIEINASHGRSFERFTSGTKMRRTSINAGVGLAFADGRVAVGRPVRSGFAIVDIHDSLSDSEIKIDPLGDSHKAGYDGLGPILVSDISAYSRTTLPYEVDNLPVGYDVGAGAFEFFAPYKSGYRVMIGSEFSVTAAGTLTDREGKPLPLQAGTLSSEAFPDKRIVAFTNGVGVFSAPGLRAGEWLFELNDDPSKKYVVRIPADAGSYVELGVLAPRS
jgi:outer membrane usher protein